MAHPYEVLSSRISDKHPVVIDFGNAYTKCGFASEYSPRAIIPTKLDDWETGLRGNVIDYNRSDEQQRHYMKKFIYKIYYKHLLVAPKDRRVVIVESILAPTNFRNMIASILFNDFDAPSVLFAPTHLLSTFTYGIRSALVVDVGYSESLVIPIYESVAMLNCWEASPKCSAKFVHQNVRKLIDAHAKIYNRDDELSPTECPDLITDSIVEDVSVRLCFATHRDRGVQIQNGLRIMENDNEASPDFPTPPPEVAYPMPDDRVMKIPGLIREGALEPLFEYDDDEKSIPQLILDSLLKVPMDLRKTLAEKIVVIGGGCMAPGFMARLRSELLHLVENEYRERLHISNFKFYPSSGKPNYNAWLGGSLFGCLEILPHRSVSKEEYERCPKIPDWVNKIADDFIPEGMIDPEKRI